MFDFSRAKLRHSFSGHQGDELSLIRLYYLPTSGVYGLVVYYFLPFHPYTMLL